MASYARSCLATLLLLAFGYLLLLGLSKHIDSQRLCTGFSACMLFHNDFRSPPEAYIDDRPLLNSTQLEAYWNSERDDPTLWTNEESSLRKIPEYVLEHAPYVHLYSKEIYWPADIAQHLAHIEPYLNREKIQDERSTVTLDSLNDLNNVRDSSDGQSIYLHSNCDAENPPSWLVGAENIPRAMEHERKSEGSHTNILPSLEDQSRRSIDGDALSNSQLELQSNLRDRVHTDGSRSRERPASHCRSIFGWSGTSHKHCTNFCDATVGNCKDENRFAKDPHFDLKRRSIDGNSHEQQARSIQAGRSQAPAILIVVPKEDGIVDAFWFFFYSYNFGPGVLNKHFGNHLGDWEHTAVRFKHGQPHSVFLSSHSRGTALSWNALEKYSWEGSTLLSSWANSTSVSDVKRPVVYSAVGSHAMYATPGVQPYGLPWSLLHDTTDRGPLWDPSLNVKSYVYDPKTDLLRSSTLNPRAPTGWFHYAGRWGTLPFPYSDSRQYSLAGEYHYKIGPTGPKFKFLDRQAICPKARRCNVKNSVKLGRSPRLTARSETQRQWRRP